MTTSRATEDERRRGRPRAPRTVLELAKLYAHTINEQVNPGDVLKWPSAKYQNDPVGFARDILGVCLWDKQIEILEAVRDHKRVAVSSGHKVSKSFTAVILSLWFYCSFEASRVVMTSTTDRQVNLVLWRELRMMLRRAGRCDGCRKRDPYGVSRCSACESNRVIDGRSGELARSGLKSDFREIVGYTAKEAEGVAGTSSPNLLYIADEASGIEDPIFEAMDGNMMGGARLVMFSNPTKCEGRFFEAFFRRKDFYKTIRISSEDTPNYKAGKRIIPGLAERAEIDQLREEWGEDSVFFRVRVKGEHCPNEEGKAVSLHLLEQAKERWKDRFESETVKHPEGCLQIGLDPAGDGTDGDESVFAPRRGPVIYPLVAFTKQTPESLWTHLQGIIAIHRRPREIPIVLIDSLGPGWKTWKHFRDEADKLRGTPREIEIRGIRASDNAMREPRVYPKIRDELWANFVLWLKREGELPDDPKLESDLHAPDWQQQTDGRVKITPKFDLRKRLGRSPDRGDAVVLSTWELSTAQLPDNGAASTGPKIEDYRVSSAGDVYGGAISPYVR